MKFLKTFIKIQRMKISYLYQKISLSLLHLLQLIHKLNFSFYALC